MVNQETKNKIGIYGANFLVPNVIGFLQNTPQISSIAKSIPGLENLANSANPYGALGFGVLDIVGKISPHIKNSKFTRLAQLGGAAYYGISSVLDVFSIAKGDYASFTNLLFDSSMAYQLGKDTFKNYQGSNDFFRDITKW